VRRTAGAGLGLLGAAGLTISGLVAASPIDPHPWTPTPPVPLTGAWAPGDRLEGLRRVSTGEVVGPEDVAVLPDGSVVASMADHTILRWSADLAGPPSVFARTGGRPLGMDVGPDGRLFVAVAGVGLVAFDAHGHEEVLCREADGVPLGFADDVEVGPDDVAYVSDVTTRFPFESWKLDVVENGTTGRLVAVDLATGACREVASGLSFANGVAVAADASFALVVETSRYRVRRVWLTGERRGTTEVFLDGLPGFPDGISRGEDGRFWLTLASTRNAIVDLGAARPWIRSLVAALPAAWQPAPEPVAIVVALEADGRVVDVLHDADGEPYGTVTSAEMIGGRLWLGSLSEQAFAWMPVPSGGQNP
jgi:sugar lactone lactonase YvrE